MRLLLTTDTVGGVWTYTRQLTEGLLEHGHSVALVSFGASPSADQRAWSLSTEDSSWNHFRYISSDLPLEWMPDNGSADVDGAALLRQVASEFQPDLFHSNQFCFGSLDLQVPRLVVAHSDVLSWAAACTPAGLPSTPWLARYIKMVQGGLNDADMLVAPTHWMLQALAVNFELPPRQQVIANGRSLPVIDRTFPRSKQAVTAGRMWDPSKNLAVFARVHACPVLIAGTSSQDAHSVDLSPTTQLLGFLPASDLFDLFRTSRIYIAASLYEPFGLAPLEAALCGCVPVLNDLASFREVWGDAALYFQTATDLECHLRDLLDDDAFFTHRQTLSIEHARSYTATAMTASYLALYRDLLQTAPSASVRNTLARTYAN